jgi:2-keto-4-pentenoate hydratase/2-oxohepta-3-ene-1,7-dioic acid hydratase in catechol pathway
MRLCRFDDGRLGLVEGDVVRDVTTALDALPACRYPLPQHDLLIAHLPDVQARIATLAGAAHVHGLDAVTLRSPVANPGKIIAAPVNYQTHLDEVRGDAQLHHGNPAHTVTIQSAGVFLKASSSIAGPGDGIVICKPERRTDHEVELACVIGRPAKQVSAAEALSFVAGYAIGLDITIRGSEDRSLRKSPDSYSVLGPWLITADEVPDPGALDLELLVNGQLRQRANTSRLILGVPQLIELASSFYTLEPGDIIYTGTPDGVGPVAAGDTIRASIAGIGTMEVRVRGH